MIVKRILVEIINIYRFHNIYDIKKNSVIYECPGIKKKREENFNNYLTEPKRRAG